MNRYNNTPPEAITQSLLDRATDISIVTGEGERGAFEEYTGKRTARAVRARLTKERCGGDRWAFLVVDGQRVLAP